MFIGSYFNMLIFFTTDKAIYNSTKDSSNDRGNPEKPKLRNRPITYKNSNSLAARRIVDSSFPF